jgi:hypothetical protein
MKGIAIVSLLLAACSTPTVTKVETVEVKVPVAVQPIRADQVPAVPAPLPPRSGNLSADADTLLAKVCDFAAYAIKADPLLRLSAGLPPAPLPRFPACERSPATATPAPPPGR